MRHDPRMQHCSWAHGARTCVPSAFAQQQLMLIARTSAAAALLLLQHVCSTHASMQQQ
jgi:hypothetical protein